MKQHTLKIPVIDLSPSSDTTSEKVKLCMPCCVAKTEKVKSWQLHQALKLLGWVAVALPLIELWQSSLVPRPSPSFRCLQYSSGDLSHLTIPQVTGSWVRAWNETNDNHYVCWVRLQGAWCSAAYAKVHHCLWHYKLLMHAEWMALCKLALGDPWTQATSMAREVTFPSVCGQIQG